MNILRCTFAKSFWQHDEDDSGSTDVILAGTPGEVLGVRWDTETQPPPEEPMVDVRVDAYAFADMNTDNESYLYANVRNVERRLVVSVPADYLVFKSITTNSQLT